LCAEEGSRNQLRAICVPADAEKEMRFGVPTAATVKINVFWDNIRVV
jgi:hypothetical protein